MHAWWRWLRACDRFDRCTRPRFGNSPQLCRLRRGGQYDEQRPQRPVRAAYAGMFYHLPLALSAHLNAGGSVVPAVVGLVSLLVSFSTQNSAHAKKSPYPAGSAA